jgi:predicted DNA-binding transcriptional regulator AlpA
MSALIDTGTIASLLGVSREYVTDKLTKRPDFPRPRVNVSQRLRKWSEAEVRAWLEQPKHKKAA